MRRLSSARRMSVPSRQSDTVSGLDKLLRNVHRKNVDATGTQLRQPAIAEVHGPL